MKQQRTAVFLLNFLWKGQRNAIETTWEIMAVDEICSLYMYAPAELHGASLHIYMRDYILTHKLISWDLTDRDGNTVPLNENTIRSLPVYVVNLMFDQYQKYIGEYLDGLSIPERQLWRLEKSLNSMKDRFLRN